MVDEAGLDASQIAGTGPDGRIIAADVTDFMKQPRAAVEAPAQAQPKAATPQQAATATQAPDVQYEDFENSTIRKVIAERLTFSKQNIPHYYVTVGVCVDKLIAMRARLNKHSKSKISVNDMVIKAASLASTNVPETNSSWNDAYVRQFKHVNMCVAV